VVALQAVIQMVDDYFLADKGLPTDGPLMKVSNNDKKIVDTCYVGVSRARIIIRRYIPPIPHLQFLSLERKRNEQ
jgi:hypothetical protein